VPLKHSAKKIQVLLLDISRIYGNLVKLIILATFTIITI